jgi:hypothetical protein
MDVKPFRNPGIDLFEEVQELGCAVSPVALADDEPRGDIERGKQRGRTMPHIAVRTTLRYAGHHRQDRLLAIECLNLAFLIDAEDKGSVRRGQVKPTMSRALSTSRGSLDNLNVWLRCGCKPNADHIRRIVVWEKPVSAAIERIDQCVASAGVVRNVRSITAAT